MRVLAEATTIIIEPQLRQVLEQDEVKLRDDHKLIEVNNLNDIVSAVNSVRNGSQCDDIVAWLSVGDPLSEGEICTHPVQEVIALCSAAGMKVGVVASLTYPQIGSMRFGLHLPNSYQRIKISKGEETPVPKSGDLLLHSPPGCLETTSKSLRKSGYKASEPVLLVSCDENIRPPEQTTVGKLARFENEENKSHNLVSIGPYMNNPRIDWIQSRPLNGWRILLPITNTTYPSVLRRLSIYGANYQVVPTMSIEPPRSNTQLEKCVHGIVEGSYQWIVFTSLHAVRIIVEQMREYGLDARSFAGLRVAVTDVEAEEFLRTWGIEPDFIPDVRTAAGLAEEFPFYDPLLDPINRVLIPKAEVAIDPLVSGLENLGWEVEDVTVYRVVRAAPPAVEIRDAIKGGDFDAVLFTSSSAVRNLIGIAGKPHASTIIVAIGDATAQTCEEMGLEVSAVAVEPNPQYLVEALANFVEKRRAQQIAEGKLPLRPSQRRRRRKKRT